MAHLEFCARGLWPQLDIALASVTEQWAQVAVAGPKARALLDGVLDTATDLPFMACGPASPAAPPASVPHLVLRASSATNSRFPAASARRCSSF